MNTKPIEKTLEEQTLKLEKGDDKQQEFARQLHAITLEIKKYRKANEHPLDAETLKNIEIGGRDSRFPQPRQWLGRGPKH